MKKIVLSFMFAASLVGSQLNAFTVNIKKIENNSDSFVRVEAPFNNFYANMFTYHSYHTKNVDAKSILEKPEEKKLLGMRRRDQELSIFDHLKIEPFDPKNNLNTFVITKAGLFVLFTSENEKGGTIWAQSAFEGKVYVVEEGLDISNKNHEGTLVINEDGTL